jgi:hypothetical protein
VRRRPGGDELRLHDRGEWHHELIDRQLHGALPVAIRAW